MLIDLIAGARPNFMKIAPIAHAITKAHASGANIRFRLIHTGQHYDKNMSDTFFEELNIPHPDVNLGAGGGTQAEQTAAIMVGYESLLLTQGKPDVCLVVGDVTSTMSCSITAKKLRVTVVHVEAGIRSGDWTMPEEINRLVTDSITDHFYTTSDVANGNLRKAGVGDDRIHFVGNTMIDTLLANRSRFTPPAFWSSLALEPKQYLVLTLHRPANVDQPESLKALLDEIIAHSESVPLVFPVHPRTRRNIEALGYAHPRLHLVDPMGYLTFNFLVEHSKAVITDSGGITEETTVMGIPCLTLRDNTERPETIDMGTNELIGTNPSAIAPALNRLFAGQWKKGGIPPLWDGETANRIVADLLRLYQACP
jgi:UDP-N-acetylglucosamine 2-epimerase (non-hydrolysing)